MKYRPYHGNGSLSYFTPSSIVGYTRMKPCLKVVLLDTHDVSRHGMTSLLDRADMCLVHNLTSLIELDTCLHEKFCDVMLLDDALPKAVDASRAVRRIKVRSPETAIIVLSQKLHLGYIQQLIWDGARGFIYKGEQMATILSMAIQTVYQGDLYLSPKATALQFQTQLHHDTLSTRDIQVLQLLQNGLTINEIAESLQLDCQTV